jgi:2-methylcitrate dehydratase PrpD
MSLTRQLGHQLGHFVASLDPAAIPAEAGRTVRRGIADMVGVLYAGRDEPVVGHALAMTAVGPAGESRVLGDRGQASAPDAAFVNATAAHALDYDDTGLDGHPSVVLGPAVLAEGEARGRTWAEVLAAYVAGYEVWAELSGRDADRHHGKGWHPTAVFGTVACAAAGARLHRLDAAQAAHALGIAASMAAGLVSNFGSMTKPLQVGWAARNGLLAARLAARGVTASADALESPRGFLAAISPAGRVRLGGDAAAGAPWQILQQGLNIKRYPVCYALHRAVDAALALRPALVADPSAGWAGTAAIQRIVRIDVELGHLQAAMLRASRPTTGLDAKFSAEYALACALARGHLGLADLNDDAVRAPDLQALLQRVHVHPVAAQDAQEPLFSPADVVRVTLDGGRLLVSAPVARALGHASRPIDEAALRVKFDDCGGPADWWRAVMESTDHESCRPPGQDAAPVPG